MQSNDTLWTVWYEDRFGWGEDRDPASLVALFYEKEVADRYIETHEGPIDAANGKFDGLFLKEWKISELIGAGLVSKDDIQRLRSQSPPATLIRHWEQGWISG